MRVLAIDQGTSGTKAVVVDGDDAIRAIAEVPIRPEYRAGGIVEQDPGELLASMLSAGRQALDASGSAVDAIALANQGESVLAWDPADGSPRSPIIVWQDGRAQEVCDPLREHVDLVRERTGLVLDPYFSAPKLAWLRCNGWTDGVVTTTDAWLLHHLTGEFVTDAATASRSLVTGLDDVTYDPELLTLFGLADERMPRIIANDAIVGDTTAFGARTPVAGVVVDQQAALIAEDCLDAGSAKCTFGTGAFLLANNGASAARSAHGLTVSVAWRVRGATHYCSDGQVFTVASAIRWLQDVGIVRDARELDELATDDAHGVLCIPALAGLAAPWWRPDATASLRGMTLATTRSDLVTAVLQGIAVQVAMLVDLIGRDSGTPLTSLRVDGGLTRSTRFMQAVADLAQVPVTVYPTPHATPLGAVALARMALDPASSLPDAIVRWQPERTILPQWSADRAGDFRARWDAEARHAIGEAS